MKSSPSAPPFAVRLPRFVRSFGWLLALPLAAVGHAEAPAGPSEATTEGRTTPAFLPALVGNPAGPGGPPPTLLRFSTEYVGQSSLGEGGAKASFYQVGALTEMSFAITGPLTGSLGLGVENRGYNFSDFDAFIPGVGDPLDNALAARIAPGLGYRLNDKWRLFAGGSWLYTGAYGSAVSDATMWGGAAGAIYQVTPDLTLVAGFSFTERLDASNLYVPIFGFNWQINERWALVAGDIATTINGPTVGAQISYRLNDRWTLFGLGGYESTYTRLGDAGALTDGTFRYRAGAALFGFEWQVATAVVLRLYCGANLAQEYTFQNQGRAELGSDNTGNSPVVGAVVRVAF